MQMIEIHAQMKRKITNTIKIQMKVKIKKK